MKMLKPPSRKKKSEKESISSYEPYDDRPRLSFKETELPAIKDWSVGKEYELKIKVKMTGSSEMDYSDDKGKIRGDFKITGVEVTE